MQQLTKVNIYNIMMSIEHDQNHSKKLFSLLARFFLDSFNVKAGWPLLKDYIEFKDFSKIFSRCFFSFLRIFFKIKAKKRFSAMKQINQKKTLYAKMKMLNKDFQRFLRLFLIFQFSITLNFLVHNLTGKNVHK